MKVHWRDAGSFEYKSPNTIWILPDIPDEDSALALLYDKEEGYELEEPDEEERRKITDELYEFSKKLGLPVWSTARKHLPRMVTPSWGRPPNSITASWPWDSTRSA